MSTFIFLPGVLFWSLIAYQERKKNLWRPFLRNLCLPLLLIPLIPAFPIILSLVKFLAIFNQGVQMNQLKTIVSLCEGQVESFLQLGLQIYIILERLDRKPSSGVFHICLCITYGSATCESYMNLSLLKSCSKIVPIPINYNSTQNYSKVLA